MNGQEQHGSTEQYLESPQHNSRPEDRTLKMSCLASDVVQL